MNDNKKIEDRLWEAADELRANSALKVSQFSTPVLGLVFLRYADHKFAEAEKKLKGKSSGRRKIGKTDYQAEGVLFIRDSARFKTLLDLPEGADIGKAINNAMEAIEEDNPSVSGTLPKNYQMLENSTLVELLKLMQSIPMDIEGDVFGKVYEEFLGNFASMEGARGGEFFTPTSLVKLIVHVIQPFKGRVYDPCCGSGGMFVQSAAFVKQHRKNQKGKPVSEISIYGQEKTDETVKLCKMNLAVHGLEGDIREGNTYYEFLHSDSGPFDFVMANPPFNVNKVDRQMLKDKRTRYPFGMPRVDNANYLWIQIFYSSLKRGGRTGFVMSNAAADARASEAEIRRKIIEDKVVDVMVAVGSNFFHNVTLPCTLWFFDKGKRDTECADKVLFIDARHVYTQVDRAHRKFTDQQVEFLANIARLYRGEEPENLYGGADMLAEKFPKGKYVDVPGLCKVATIEEIEAQGWSLNPGRYVGVAEGTEEDFDFTERLEELAEELQALNSEARELEERIAENVNKLLEE